LLAALAAKRAIGILDRIDAVTTALGAGHNFGAGLSVSGADCHRRQILGNWVLGTQRKFKGTIGTAGVQPVIVAMLHQADRHHQPVTTDFWNDFLAGV
jgi:hypothetical protein